MTARLILADDSSNSPLNVTARDTAPDMPVANDIYLDDGTNTASGEPGFRQWDGANWNDLNGAVQGIALGASAIKTLANGEITVGSDRNIVVAAESGTADDLDTITGTSEGDTVILRANTGDVITVKNGVDNIELDGGADIPLTGNATLLLVNIDGTTLRQPVDGNSGGGGGGLTTAANYLSSNVTMTNANTFYDGPSLSLAAGTWFLSGYITPIVTTSNGAWTAKLWDGTTTVSAGQMIQVSGLGPSGIAISGIVSPVVTTTYKISLACTGAGNAIAAASAANSPGNYASYLNAVKVG